MLEVKAVTKYYGNFRAVDKLSFTVKPGEIFGLLGVNGAGKTTTFRMIMGLIDMNEGEITWNGNKIGYDITDQIGFLTEERSLLTKMTVFEQIRYFGVLKGMDEEKIEEELDKLLNKFEIIDYKNRKIKELSKGNQQKIQLISAIINKPKLLILDEPFAGLDPLNAEMFKNAIIELKENGTAIIFSSHRMEQVEMFCEKLVILVKGKDVISGYLKDIKKSYRQKNILINGDVKKAELQKITGVKEVEKLGDSYLVRIESEKNIDNVFDYVKNQTNITKFVVEEPTLNEIFVAKVGESYEQEV